MDQPHPQDNTRSFYMVAYILNEEFDALPSYMLLNMGDMLRTSTSLRKPGAPKKTCHIHESCDVTTLSMTIE